MARGVSSSVNPAMQRTIETIGKIQDAYKGVIDALATLNGVLHPMVAKSSHLIGGNYEAMGASDKIKVARDLLVAFGVSLPDVRKSYVHCPCYVCGSQTKHIATQWIWSEGEEHISSLVCLDCRIEVPCTPSVS